jgi:ATP-dependent Clp protease adapter protein ClpS
VGLWQRLRAAFAPPSDDGTDQTTRWYESALSFAKRDNRKVPSVDDLFFSLGFDDDIGAFLIEHGTSYEQLTDDIAALQAESATRVTDADVAAAAAERAAAATSTASSKKKARAPRVPKNMPDREARGAAIAVANACALAWWHIKDDPEASAPLALFQECLRPGPPAFVRDAFEARTKTTLRRVRFKAAHGVDVDVDDSGAGDAAAATRRAYVVLYNDPYSTQEFVVGALERHAHLTPHDALTLMNTVHHVGVAVVAEGLTDDMRAIKRAIDAAAARTGHPLRVRLEPVVDGLDP